MRLWPPKPLCNLDRVLVVSVTTDAGLLEKVLWGTFKRLCKPDLVLVRFVISEGVLDELPYPLSRLPRPDRVLSVSRLSSSSDRCDTNRYLPLSFFLRIKYKQIARIIPPATSKQKNIANTGLRFGFGVKGKSKSVVSFIVVAEVVSAGVVGEGVVVEVVVVVVVVLIGGITVPLWV